MYSFLQTSSRSIYFHHKQNSAPILNIKIGNIDTLDTKSIGTLSFSIFLTYICTRISSKTHLMPKDQSIKSVFIIGSGPIVIGQACEFDYSGTQAARSLREEGIEVILINSNPATIMTDSVTADHIYLLPLTPESIETILQNHHVDAVLPTMGGQTALNLAIEAGKLGIWEKYNTRMIGEIGRASCREREYMSVGAV